MATDQQLAALSQFTSNIQSHHDHDQTTLYVLQDPTAGHHDGDHQHVRLHLDCIIVPCRFSRAEKLGELSPLSYIVSSNTN